MNNQTFMPDSTSSQTLAFELYPKMGTKKNILHQKPLCLLHPVLSQYNG
jgi:hypothetical protein